MESRNSWQNVGFFTVYAFDNIPRKYRDTYIWIVRNSVGYGQEYTNQYSLKEISRSAGRGYNQLISDIHWLLENNHIKRIGHYGNIKGGGSTPYQYGIVFPKNFKVWLKDKKQNNTDGW